MKAQSANEIIEEARNDPTTSVDPFLWQFWVANVESAVRGNGATMDDKIFILDEDGRHYSIDPEYANQTQQAEDAYDRAMKGL